MIWEFSSPYFVFCFKSTGFDGYFFVEEEPKYNPLIIYCSSVASQLISIMGNVLIVADSRGKGMQYILDRIDLKGLFLDAIYWRSRHHYDIICIMGGICNVTTRSKTTRITTLRTMDTDTAIINYVYEMNKGLDSLNAQYPDQVTIMIPIVGVDLSKYSAILGQSVEQNTVNHIITAINAKITDCDNSRNLPTPNVANIIHRCKGKGTWSHRYKYLSDGCHYTLT